MPNGDKKKAPIGGLMQALMLPQQNVVPLHPQGNTTDYDSIPSFLSYIKSVQEGNQLGASQALSHVKDVHGEDMVRDLQFLGQKLGQSNINDLARRGVDTERNDQLRRLYAMINENPDLIDKFQYSLPQNSGGGLAMGMRR